MQTIRITTTQNIDIDYELAGLGERMVAYLIDFGLFFFILIASLMFIGATGLQSSDLVIGVLIGIYATLYVFYDLICELSMNGQSVGKRIMKIKVISLDGGRPRFSQFLLRWLFRLVDFPISSYVCGLICIAVSDKAQRVGDMVAGTSLIRTVPRTKMNSISFASGADDYQPVFATASELNDADIELITEVINTYLKSRNSVLVYNMAQRIKELLNLTTPPDMNDMLFLQTIIKDYSHITAQAAVL